MELLTPEMNVSKIVLALFVPEGTGAVTHRSRPSHGLALHSGGQKIYHFAGGPSIQIGENDLIYMPKHSDYDVEEILPGDCWAINFDLDVDFIGTPQSWHIPNDTGMAERFQLASELWLKKGDFFELKIKGILYELLYQLALLSRKPEKKKFDRLAPAVSYLESHYTDPELSVTYLANLCNISDTYFRRLFEERFRTTPVKYIIERRLRLAEELLSSAMYSVGEVQRICGYSDACIFSRAFRKRTGLSPKQYLKGGSPPR